MLHTPNRPGTHTKPLWTFLRMDLILLPMEEKEKLMEVIARAL
jgi:hypothetical protein